jgi:hypothetical protein
MKSGLHRSGKKKIKIKGKERASIPATLPLDGLALGRPAAWHGSRARQLAGPNPAGSVQSVRFFFLFFFFFCFLFVS